MSHRQSFTQGVGITYPHGTTLASTVTNVYYSQTSSKIIAFSGHPVEVFADNAVWDTVTNSYLFPGRDYQPL